MKANDALLVLSLKYEGDWPKIYHALRIKEKITDEEIEEAKKKVTTPFLTIMDDNYPSFLSQIRHPPLILYYYGNLELLTSPYRLTCVGTRKPTVYQESKSYDLIKEAEEKFNNKLTIVSGMAHGIDQVCMEAALEKDAPLISVIGSGIDNPYPPQNNGIYEYCKSQKGLILSEYPLKTKAQPANFVFRNRLLGAIGQVIYVGGAKNASGTATTVTFGLESGKEIICLPCNISGDDLTNSLIHEGARPVLGVEDIVDSFSKFEKTSTENIS